MPPPAGSGPKTYRSIVQGFELVTEFKRSGLTPGEFARQHNLSRRCLNYWIGRATALATAAASSPTGFVEVTPLALPEPTSSSPVPAVPPTGSTIDMRLPGGAVIHLRPGFDAQLLRAILQAVAC